MTALSYVQRLVSSQSQVTTMTPKEFVDLYVPLKHPGMQPGDRGFQKLAAQELSEALGRTTSPSTIIAHWGADFSRCPDIVPWTLALVHSIRTITSSINALHDRGIR